MLEFFPKVPYIFNFKSFSHRVHTPELLTNTDVMDRSDRCASGTMTSTTTTLLRWFKVIVSRKTSSVPTMIELGPFKVAEEAAGAVYIEKATNVIRIA